MWARGMRRSTGACPTDAQGGGRVHMKKARLQKERSKQEGKAAQAGG
jgi:hypothetical protein